MTDSPLPPLTPPPPLDPQSSSDSSSQNLPSLNQGNSVDSKPSSEVKPAPPAAPFGTPPPITVDPSKLEAVSPLSPQRILQRRDQGEPFPPVPDDSASHSATPSPTPQDQEREQLLQQIAEAPVESFALPSSESLSGTGGGTSVSAPSSGPSLLNEPLPEDRPATSPAATPKPQMTAPVATPATPEPLKQRIEALKPQAVPAASPASPPGRMDGLPNIAVQPRKPSRAGLWLGIGALLILLLAGSSYLLVTLRGTRIPVVYSFLTGLPTDGAATAQEALAFVTSQGGYQFEGSVALNEPRQAATSDRPTLPDATDAEVAGRVYSLETEVLDGEYRQDGTFRGRLELVINAPDPTITEATPVYFGVKSVSATAVQGGNEQFLTYFPDSLTPQILAISTAPVKKTLLYPALKPTSLSTLLSAIQAEGGYAYQREEGVVPTVVYAYTVDATKLAGAFPEGAEFENLRLDVYYTTKTELAPAAVPLRAELTGTLKYQGRSYEMSQEYVYSIWDTELSLDDEAYKQIAAATTGTERGVKEMINEWGILSLNALPNSLSDEESGELKPPFTPTNASSTTPIPAVTSFGPPPTRPVSDAAAAEDAKRRADLQLIQKALAAYHAANNSYPVALDFIQLASVQRFFDVLVPTYLTAVPVDPQSTAYYYSYKSDGVTYTLRAVALDLEHPDANLGSTYPYYQYTNP